MLVHALNSLEVVVVSSIHPFCLKTCRETKATSTTLITLSMRAECRKPPPSTRKVYRNEYAIRWSDSSRCFIWRRAPSMKEVTLLDAASAAVVVVVAVVVSCLVIG